MPSRSRVLLALVVGLALAAAGPGQAEPTRTSLKDNGVPTDGPGLLTYFKKRTLADDTRAKVAQAHPAARGRRVQPARAGQQRPRRPRRARPRPARPGDQGRRPGVRRRARRILIKLGPAAAENNLYPVAARVLANEEARRGGRGAARTSCRASRTWRSPRRWPGRCPPLTMSKDGKADPAVLAALTDRFAIKRDSAAEALIAAGGAAHRPAASKLLKDAEPGVRRRVAVALLHGPREGRRPGPARAAAVEVVRRRRRRRGRPGDPRRARPPPPRRTPTAPPPASATSRAGRTGGRRRARRSTSPRST